MASLADLIDERDVANQRIVDFLTEKWDAEHARRMKLEDDVAFLCEHITILKAENAAMKAEIWYCNPETGGKRIAELEAQIKGQQARVQVAEEGADEYLKLVRALEGQCDKCDKRLAELEAENAGWVAGYKERQEEIARLRHIILPWEDGETDVVRKQEEIIHKIEAENAAVRGTLARFEDEATNLRRTNAALEAENARLKKPLTVEISQADLDAAAHNFPLRPNVQLGDHLSPERKAELDAMKPVDMPAFANKVLGGPKA